MKELKDTISHSCVKDQDSCLSGELALGIGFSGAVETADVAQDYVQCQTGKPGETLQFLFKDGSGCKDLGSITMAPLLGNGLSGSCEPRPDTLKSCTGNKEGVECIWTVKLPVKGGGGGGMFAHLFVFH